MGRVLPIGTTCEIVEVVDCTSSTSAEVTVDTYACNGYVVGGAAPCRVFPPGPTTTTEFRSCPGGCGQVSGEDRCYLQ